MMTVLGFNAPGTTKTVCDISHHNENVDFNKVKSAGILGVIHKATQSYGATLYHDKMYPERRIAAKAAGLLWGAYHFGTGGNGKGQADAFLAYTKPDQDTLLVLDFERSTTSGETSMSLQDAKDFVSEIQQKTGKYPGIYGGALLRETLKASPDPVLSQCWLWIAQYASVPQLPNGWQDYTLWQYTDGINGPGALPVDGIGPCDRDLYRGSPGELVQFWKNHQV